MNSSAFGARAGVEHGQERDHPAAAILAFVIGTVVWKIRDNAAARESARDESLRAGQATSPDGDVAARRAEGSLSWVRTSDSAGL